MKKATRFFQKYNPANIANIDKILRGGLGIDNARGDVLAVSGLDEFGRMLPGVNERVVGGAAAAEALHRHAEPAFEVSRIVDAGFGRLDDRVQHDAGELELIGTRLRQLLSPNPSGTSFQVRYDEAMQTNPSIKSKRTLFSVAQQSATSPNTFPHISVQSLTRINSTSAFSNPISFTHPSFNP